MSAASEESTISSLLKSAAAICSGVKLPALPACTSAYCLSINAASEESTAPSSFTSPRVSTGVGAVVVVVSGVWAVVVVEPFSSDEPGTSVVVVVDVVAEVVVVVAATAFQPA